MRSEEIIQAYPLWEDGQRKVETDGKDMRGIDWRSHYTEIQIIFTAFLLYQTE